MNEQDTQLNQDTGPSAEDNDPLTAAAEMLPEAVEVYRKPGLLVFRLAVADLGGRLTVTRSRFDGDYGNICRLSLQTKESVENRYCPSFMILEAISDPSRHAEMLTELFKSLKGQGEENGTEEN